APIRPGSLLTINERVTGFVIMMTALGPKRTSTVLLASKGSLRPFPHELQRHAGRVTGIPELHFLRRDGSNDPPLTSAVLRTARRPHSRPSSYSPAMK